MHPVFGRRTNSLANRIALLLGGLLLGLNASASPDFDTASHAPLRNDAPNDSGTVLRVMTLNVAHGRSTSFNQLLLSRDVLQRNLASIAELLERHAPHVVALQEADGPSRWSGGFDHVRSVADGARFPWRFRGDHAEGWLYRYGTALLSRLPMQETASYRFEPTPPTPRKGFVVGSVNWPAPRAGGASAVGVVSVHFDYLSRAAQQRQFEQLADTLQAWHGPLVVLGDFNSSWSTPDSPVRRLAERLDLHTWQPSAAALATHEGKRIDWILVSPELRISHYAVLPDQVSDHHAVIAEITRRDATI